MEQKLLSTADVVQNLQNVQIYPTDKRVEINDVFSKLIFKCGALSGQKYHFTEKKASVKRNGKKAKPAIKTKFTVSNPDVDVIKLTEFDRAVLSACISEQKAGNLYTTINIIFRSLIGQVGKKSIYPSKNQHAAIADSLNILTSTNINFPNLDKNLEEMGYIADAKDFKLKEAPFIPAIRLDCKINGQLVEDVIYFTLQSPLLERAEKLNQIVRFDAELLDVPNQNNSPLIIALKTYVLRRVAEIKLHKQMFPTITFDDVFQKCDLTDANAKKKFHARDEIFKLFEHLKNKNFISEYGQKKSGVSVYGVNFKK